ncbi:hypothetical protein AMECASPLE_027772 [Ameca splendens]|uniref:Uncharacterized protein n=1 Tax=Ameca splendens TaxID=208324 RepID=A0ABV0ZEH8_9TELE
MQRKNMQTRTCKLQAERPKDPGPSCCKATVLPTVPSCSPYCSYSSSKSISQGKLTSGCPMYAIMLSANKPNLFFKPSSSTPLIFWFCLIAWIDSSCLVDLSNLIHSVKFPFTFTLAVAT